MQLQLQKNVIILVNILPDLTTVYCTFFLCMLNSKKMNIKKVGAANKSICIYLILEIFARNQNFTYNTGCSYEIFCELNICPVYWFSKFVIENSAFPNIKMILDVFISNTSVKSQILFTIKLSTFTAGIIFTLN